jgi:hypothetical protein
VGSSIGSMLAKVGGASLSHTAAHEDTLVSHELASLASPTTSPTLEFTAAKSALVSAQPVVHETQHAAAPEFAHGMPIYAASHLVFDHFVAIA